jgi:hypothetical protein
MNPTRRVLPIALAAILLAGCGPSTSDRRPGDGSVRSRTDALTYLAGVESGEIRGEAFVAVGDGAVVFGGRHTTGDVERVGVYLGKDGSTAVFDAPVGMVDMSVVAVGSVAFVTGRRCEGPAERTDTGVRCTPGTLAVIRIDTTTMTTRTVSVGRLKADQSGSSLQPELFRRDRDVVLEVSTPGARSTSRLSAAAEPLPLPSAPGPVVCSTGDTLVAAARPPVLSPPDAIPGDRDTTNDPGIAVLASGRKDWVIDQLPTPARGGVRACSHGWLSVLPTRGGEVTLWMRDATNGHWHESPKISLDGTPYALTNSASASFVVTDGSHYIRIDPNAGTAEAMDVPALPLEGGPTRVLSAAGEVLALTAELQLAVYR